MSDQGTPRRGIPAEDCDDEFDIETTAGRRWRYDFAEDETLVPPPVPVLPGAEPSGLLGRRFAIEDLPDDWEPPLPRHSATSPSHLRQSPVSVASPTVVPPPAPVGASAEATPRVEGLPSTRKAADGTAPRPRWVWGLLAGLVLLAIILTWFLVSRTGGSVVQTGTPMTPAASAQAGLLAAPSELAALREGTTWTSTDDLAPDETRGVVCIAPSSQLQAPPTTLVRRTLTATTGDPATVVQQVEIYRSAEAARQSFAARVAQLGGCTGAPALLAKGFKLTGLGDEAVGIQATEQAEGPIQHLVTVVRTGSTILVSDAGQANNPLAMDAVAKAGVPSLGRLCGPAKGACPDTVGVQEADLPAGNPSGWLTPGDLPRVTAGAGAWVDAAIQPMQIPGSACEDVDLAKVPDATSASQRGFVLDQDPKAPLHFGLDETLYTFGSDAAAQAFATSVMDNVSGCSKRTGTATVAPLGKVEAPATGQLFTVDRRVNLNKAARFRVGVAAIGNRAMYFAANPDANFDLSDEQWLAVLQRAVVRLKQAS